jgi:hypothetical protein
VGRAGIRRRKPKVKLRPPNDTGIIADLEDQAAWSSYGSGVVRGGNLRRSAIWFRRGWRFYGNLVPRRVRHNPAIHDSGFWPAIFVGAIGIAVFIVMALLALRIVGALLD